MKRLFPLLLLLLVDGCVQQDPSPRFTPAWERFNPSETTWWKSRVALLCADCQFNNNYCCTTSLYLMTCFDEPAVTVVELVVPSGAVGPHVSEVSGGRGDVGNLPDVRVRVLGDADSSDFTNGGLRTRASDPDSRHFSIGI